MMLKDIKVGDKVKVNVTSKEYKLAGTIIDITETNVMVAVPTYYGQSDTKILIELPIENGKVKGYMAKVQ